MPSLFNRRSRSMSTSRPTPPPPPSSSSSSAHMAAAQAFLASRPSQSNLSASAAAAALRSMSPSSTPVNQVQTKRMLNRQPSNSSTTNAPRGRSRGTLQRTPSGGSMTERTFRSPSPGRPANSTPSVGRGVPPPVPTIPQTYTTEDIPPIPKKSHRRSTSMESPPTRVLSPPPTRSTGQGVNTNQNTVSSAATLAARRSANLPQAPELERTDSRNSINFSYPRGSRPSSPPPSSPNVANGTSAQGISAAEASQIQNSLIKTAEKPVKKKKKIVGPNVAQGTHLQAGSIGGKSETPSSISISDQSLQSSVVPVGKKKKSVGLSGESTHFPDSGTGNASGIPSDSDAISDKTKDKRAQRASGVLVKQPSIVREDWEGEQGEEPSPISPTQILNAHDGTSTSTTASVPARKSASEANTSRKIEEPVVISKMSYNAVTTPSPSTATNANALSAGNSAARHTSISPSRSTRFSDRLSSDLASGRKHEPLPRSVSPAKSALKHHSPSRSDTSPTEGRFPHRRTSSVTPSEASDTSTDGWRRKSSRVSFEASPEVAGLASESSASNKGLKESGKKGWLGKPKTSALGTIPAEEEDAEDVLKPRPALPAFGSVRRSRPDDSTNLSGSTRDVTGDNNTSTAASSTSDVSSVAEPSTMNTSVSSDHASGIMLSRESQEKTRAMAQPRTASARARGHVSDSESFSSDDDDRRDPAGGKSYKQRSYVTPGDVEVPMIAIQPATPGLDDSQRGDEWATDIPGGYPLTDPSNEIEAANYTVPTYAGEASGLGIGNAESIERTTTEHANIEPKTLNTIAEEDTDNDSVYSDAAEDLYEGDGFGSINAIVGTPMVASPNKDLSSPPESPSPMVQTRPDSTRVASWDDTQSHWSGIAQQFRNSAQQAKQTDVRNSPKAVPQNEPVEEVIPTRTLEPAAEIEPQPRKKKRAQIASSVPERVSSSQPQLVTSSVSNQVSIYSAATTKQPTSSKPQGGFRSSMRSEPEPTRTLRGTPKPMSIPPPTQPRAALQKKPVSAIVAPKPIQRTFSNDSDSDSSFTRARRNRKPRDSQFTMKRSMRGATAEPAPSRAAINRRDVRSMSPIDRRPTSPIDNQRMRMSMRGSHDLDTPTLRGQVEKKRSSSLFSRARKAKSPIRSTSAIPSVPKLSSRRADSDDELDAPRPTTFKSRFVDSSDEEDAEPMRPVRGIPKKTMEGDSTDLDDSSDDQRRKTDVTPKKLAITIPPLSQSIDPALMSPNTARKLGFWGKLRGKKDEDEAGFVAGSIEQNGTKAKMDKDKKMSKEDKQLGFSSAGERDALVAQTLQRLEAGKAGPASPVGKLQRRTTPQRGFSDSWPLSPQLSDVEQSRPKTSDGAEKPVRPDFGNRLPTTDTLRTDGGTAIYGKSGKKKRFPMLRRVFGLHD